MYDLTVIILSFNEESNIGKIIAVLTGFSMKIQSMEKNWLSMIILLIRQLKLSMT
jgi:hypothetical protein